MFQLYIKLKLRYPSPPVYLSPPHSLLFMGQKLVTEDPGPDSGQWRDQEEPEVSHSAHLHPSSEAATGSRWDDGAQPRCRCICLHTVLPTMARGCDSSRKTCSVSTQDVLGTSKIFSN